MHYWLMKSEPEAFSFDDLEAAPRRRTTWEGVRNYQARNYLREMKEGDGVLFYHSNAKPQLIPGTARVVKEAYPDPTQFDPRSKYFDAGSKEEDPRWSLVEIAFERRFLRPVTLQDLRDAPGLEALVVLRRGSRLSVTPVTAEEWRLILELGARRG